MTNTPNENLIRVDPVEVAPGVRQTTLKPLDSAAIARAIENLKSKIDPSKHGEVDAAVNQAMARFIDRRYTFEFSQTIKPLDDALKSAVAGETSRLAGMLGLTHITREGAQTQAQNLNEIGSARILETRAREQAQTQQQIEAARLAREQAAALQRVQEQAAAASRVAGRREVLLDTLGGKKGNPPTPTAVAQKQ